VARGVAAITAGDFSARIPPGGTAEVGEVADGFNRMADALMRQRRDLEDHQSELEAQKTELEHALGSLEERNAHIDLVRRFGDEMVAEGASVETVAVAALRGMGDGAACDVGAVYLVDLDSEAFTAVATRGVRPDEIEPTVQPGHSLAGRALAEGSLVSVSYDEATLQAAGLTGPRRVVHELHVPIRHGGQTLGVISLGRLRDEPFSAPDLQLISDLVERTGAGCVQALATRRLSRTARDLGAVLETMDEGVYGMDTAGEIILVNRAAVELTGYSREELMGANAHELLHHSHEDGTPYAVADCPIYHSSQSGEGVRVTDEVFWRKGGNAFPVEYSDYPLFEDERLSGAGGGTAAHARCGVRRAGLRAGPHVAGRRRVRVVETFGTALTIVAFAVGDVSGATFLSFLVLAFLVGILLSIAALAVEEFNFRRHQRTRDIVSLVFYTVLENLGYRQLNDLWRMMAFVDLARRKQGWGAQKRRGIGNLAGAEAPANQPLSNSLTKSR
jgi:PAS domain S-box-containing protein